MSQDVAGRRGMVCLVRMSAKSGLKKQRQAASNKPQAKSKKWAHLSAGPSTAWRDRDFAPLCGLRTTIGMVLSSLPLSGISSQIPHWRSGFHLRAPGRRAASRPQIGSSGAPRNLSAVTVASLMLQRVTAFRLHRGTGWSLWTGLFSTQWPVAKCQRHSNLALLGEAA